MGAPFYFDRMKDQGGAVYIFMNENGLFQKKASMVLKGPATSAFGFAVAAIGDINQDGFQGMTLNATFVFTPTGLCQLKRIPNSKVENMAKYLHPDSLIKKNYRMIEVKFSFYDVFLLFCCWLCIHSSP